MAGPPRVRPATGGEPETRPVLGPAGNTQKPASKPLKKVAEVKDKKKAPSPVAAKSPKVSATAPRLRQSERVAVLLGSDFSMNGSCSSDASSSDSFQSRASSSSSGRIVRRSFPMARKKPCELKVEKVVKGIGECNLEGAGDELGKKTRCAWIATNADPSYIAFHDEEWGFPIHDDKKLFELLSFSGALAEIPWPSILKKRHIFRQVFLEFNPFAVANLNEKKIAAPGNPARTLLSELKLRGIIENACQVCKVIDEYGSFDEYIWGFVNYKPIVNQFRYPRQIPAKTSKAEMISKDLVKRGFRSVGPTVIYSFMQVTGLTNDHLIGCFRFRECSDTVFGGKNKCMIGKAEAERLNDAEEMELIKEIDDLNLS